jgi:hypothetical protein
MASMPRNVTLTPNEGFAMAGKSEQPVRRARIRPDRAAATRAAAGLTGIAAATAVAVAATVTPAGASAPVTVTPTVTCTYRLQAWPGGFTADIDIANSGPTITGWVVHWTVDAPTTLGGVWLAQMVQKASDMYASNVAFNAVIPAGRVTTFGWNATSAVATVPTDLTINGQPC